MENNRGSVEQSNTASEEAMLRYFEKNKSSNLKILIHIYKNHYVELFFSIVFFIIKHSPTWVLPIATSNIINAVTEPDEKSMNTIIFNVVLMIVLVLQNIFTNYMHTLLYSKAVRNVERDLRATMVRKLQQLSITFHNAIQSGRLQSKIMRDVEQVETLSRQIFISLLSIVTTLAVALGIVVSKSMVIFVFFLASIPVAAVIMAAFRKKVKTCNSDFRHAIEEASASVMEMVELIPVTKAHGLEEAENRRMEGKLSAVAQKGLKLDVLQSYFGSVSWAVFMCFQIVCLGFTGYMALQKQILPGDVVMFQSYFTTIVNQVANLLILIPTITKGLESVRSIGDILLSDELEQTGKRQKVSNVDGNIGFEKVAFSYPDGDHPILTNFSFDIKQGETVAFVGASGAGKTTILNLVIGFQKPDSGKVLIDGRDISTLNLSSYRQHIAVVPQTSILFTGTIRDNITYGMENISDERLAEVIEAANLSDFIASLPDGLDTMVTEHGNNLSGGQRQRVAIARAFIRNPRILILDEATSALDSESEKKIQQAVDNLVKNRTTLIVAHRLSTIKNADRIAVIGNGGLMECGSYDELMEKKGEFYKLRSLQL